MASRERKILSPATGARSSWWSCRRAGQRSTSTLSERCLLRLRDLVFDIGEENLRISASLGVSVLHMQESAAAWLERADQALYEAKDSGRDQVVVHADDRV
ncbi:MAG: diguanylate cyclase [Myxococcales bacterium]|nr:diguanylate cyclase [Myxococcales bacterium]